MSIFFSDDRGNKIFGPEDSKIRSIRQRAQSGSRAKDPFQIEDDDFIKSIKQNAQNGKQRGVDGGFGKFPAPLVSPVSLEGSLGDWKSQTPIQFLPYPGVEAKSGFTKPLVADPEIEKYSYNKDLLLATSVQPINDALNKRRRDYFSYEDLGGLQFTHLLDYFQDSKKGRGVQKPIPSGDYVLSGDDVTVTGANTKDIYLGSFIRTIDDNEDPTILGYDISIIWDSSPLFNGTIEKFIQQMGSLNNSEVGSRSQILVRFKEQLFNFFNYVGRESLVAEKLEEPAKVYYLRSISGLNNLSESVDSSQIKSFVNYGTDFITLEFNEDVSQNLGYLAMVYKSLSWSRIHGKYIIPENLLRFDVKIDISEVRKYNRVFKNFDNTLDVYKDMLSKYSYKLYECQFFFNEFPHEDSIDMSSIKPVEKYTIKFNYKFSTLSFEKFNGYETITNQANQTEPARRAIYDRIDNSNNNILRIKPIDTKNNTIQGGSIISSKDEKNLNKLYNISDKSTNNIEQDGGVLSGVKKAQATNNRFDKIAQTLISNTANINVKEKKNSISSAAVLLRKDIQRAFVRESNRRLISQAALLNRTLENIRNSIPFASRMGEPRNVYGPMANNLFYNDLTNAARSFVGRSIKSFFTKP